MKKSIRSLTALTLIAVATLTYMSSNGRCRSGFCASEGDNDSFSHLDELDEVHMLQLQLSVTDVVVPAVTAKRDADANLKKMISDSLLSKNDDANKAEQTSGASTEHPADLVQVLAGTDTSNRNENSNGNTLPQIKMPWGFNDWAPETTKIGHSKRDDAWFFQRGDRAFRGMRCTHQPSPWIGDYGNFLLQPHVGEEFRPQSWSPEESIFRPYLFNATLEGIQFEFVPTSHAAILRLNFPETANVTRLSVRVPEGEIRVNTGTTIQGVAKHNNGGVPKGWKGMFFTVLALSPTRAAPFKSLLRRWVRGCSCRPSPALGKAPLRKPSCCLAPGMAANNSRFPRTGTIDFKTGQGPALVAVATSFISQEQAELNLKQEIGSKSFQELLDEGKATWTQQLGRMRIQAVDETQLAVFYTNMWKAMLFPRYLQEVNEDGEEVHRSPYTGRIHSGKLVTDSGFWDSYRAVYQFQSMVFPENLGHCIRGWLDAYKEANTLPEWPSPGVRQSMTSTLGDVVLADAIVKSKWGLLSGFDVNTAYNAISKDVFNTNQTTHSAYTNLSYIPWEYSYRDSVSITLDNYVTDDAAASAAHVLGKYEDEQLLRARSKHYGVLFNRSSHFFQPKSRHGKFMSHFDNMSWGNGFTEAGPWQYRFYVPHDVEGLNKLYDGRLCEAIQSMMLQTNGPAFRVGSYNFAIHEMNELQAIQPDFGLYAHNNQPAHHILYVAKRAGCNSLADKYLRKVMQKLYTKRGWSGDEDNGEMASWYVLSALGVYALQGAKDELVLGSPAIKHASVQLPNNTWFIVDTQNQADNHVYVQSVTWTPEGGQTHVLTGNVLKFTEFMRGGTLKFIMGASPKEGDASRI